MTIIGIFFSKDRREEVIEVEEDPEVVLIPENMERVKLMTQGQWMKGCPEGGEQSFLFGLYSELSEGECPCPQKCGATVHRKKSDFFAIFVSEAVADTIKCLLNYIHRIQSEFSTYIDRLRTIVRQTCPRCHAEFCLACGEPIAADKVKRPSAATDDDPTFHCPNLQGVVLGVGLSMIEQLFSEQSSESRENKDDNVRNMKRRKTNTLVPKDVDDEDDVYYASVAGSGKKAKGGIGYAGDIREDVCFFLPIVC